MQHIKLKFSYLVFSALLVLAACSDDDDEPATSHIKKGFFEGTVSGTRQDGTTFSEPFKYEYTSNNVELFIKYDGVNSIGFSRTLNPESGNGFMYMFMTAWPDGSVILSNTEFSFLKKVADGKLFAIKAEAAFYNTPGYIRVLSPEQNANYHFITDSGGVLYFDKTSYQDASGASVDAYRFNINTYHIYYSAATGALLAVHNLVENVTSTSGTIFNLYNNLVFKLNPSVGKVVFYDAATNTSLHQAVPGGPADEYTITNYAMNTSTGVITFDFKVTINGTLGYQSGRRNTTGNDLSITGRFNSGEEVFQEVIYGSK